MYSAYTAEEGEKVWNAFKEMKAYMEKSFLVIKGVEEGDFYLTQKNRKIYDGVSTLLNSNVGHKNPRIIKAISDQLNILDNTTLFTSTSNTAIEYAKKLCGLTKNHFYSCFFTNSGSEACDTAIKIVRKYRYNDGTGKYGIVSLRGAYHGSSIGAMLLSQTAYDKNKYFIDMDGFYQISAPEESKCPDILNQEEWIDFCINEYERLISDEGKKIGAVFLELVQLSNAVNILPVRYVRELCRISRENDILVVIDEVATGFGRTGEMFASEYYGIWGDLMMVAKGISSGYIPMGGVLVTEGVFRSFWGDDRLTLEHGFTTSGHPVACAAAIENLTQIIDNNMVANSRKQGAYLKNLLQTELGQSKLIKEIRGIGLMLAIIFDDVALLGMEEWGIADIISRFLINNGLLLYPDDSNTLIIAPPLNVTVDACDYIVKQLKNCINKAEHCIRK